MTVDPEMLKILQNLENAEQIHEKKKADRAAGIHVVKEDAQEMYDILKKFQGATEKTATKIAKQRDTNPTVAVGTMQNNTVSMSGYNVIMEKRNLTDKYKKVYYDITDSKGNVLYKDIALFESAMTVLKCLIDDNISKLNKVIELDGRYAGYLAEGAHHKARCKVITESYKKDVAIAKQSNAMDKAGRIKRDIKSLI